MWLSHGSSDAAGRNSFPCMMSAPSQCFRHNSPIPTDIRLASCRRAGGRHDMPSPLSSPRGRRSASRGRADGNIAAVSHGQHVPTPTAAAAWRTNTAVSKAAWWPWPLTFWPWKWCPSHMWSGLPLCQFWSSYIYRPLCSRLGPDVRDRQTDRRQIKASLMPPPIRGGGIITTNQYRTICHRPTRLMLIVRNVILQRC